jgi:hypothetical protein
MTITSLQQVDQTIRIFDSFYSLKLEIPAAEYDVVFSYFKGVSATEQIASNLASILFRIAQQGNYNVQNLLSAIKGADDKLQMNSIICYYLNTYKSKASLYGVGNLPKPNEAVQRNVVL